MSQFFAIQQFLQRLLQGESLQVVVIGGSITTGYNAIDRETGCWASLFEAWLKMMAKQYNSQITFTNCGIGATDSATMAMRIQDHVVAKQADLVIIETAVNDIWLDHNFRRQTFEGCLRQNIAQNSRAVLGLLLHQADDFSLSCVQEQSITCEYYSVPYLRWADHCPADRSQFFDIADPIHPNDLGHQSIASMLIKFFEAQISTKPSGSYPSQHRLLPRALYSLDFSHTKIFDSKNTTINLISGFNCGSDQHHSWLACGGAPLGWHSSKDNAQLSVSVYGKTIGVFISESKDYRNLEAWIDDAKEPVLLKGGVPERDGYLGWSYHVIGRDLTDGEHTLHVRMSADEHAGSGRVAHLCAVFSAGLHPKGNFIRTPQLPSQTAVIGLEDTHCLVTGRIGQLEGKSNAICWQGTSVELNFDGPIIGLAFEQVFDRNWFEIQLDDQSHLLFLEPNEKNIWIFEGKLSDGPHHLRLSKRSEGYFGHCALLGIIVAANAKLYPPRQRQAQIAIFGDSISAGACIEDGQTDQYDTLASHDALLSYGAVSARRLGMDLLNFSISGTGVTTSWCDLLLPTVFDCWKPLAGAERLSHDSADASAPSIVVSNLGQNDFGYPNSLGQGVSPNYGDALFQFLHALRSRYPQAWIVIALGGMEAPILSPDLLAQFKSTANRFMTQDQKSSTLIFKAFSANHPRFDIHAQLAEELVAHIRQHL